MLFAFREVEALYTQRRRAMAHTLLREQTSAIELTQFGESRHELGRFWMYLWGSKVNGSPSCMPRLLGPITTDGPSQRVHPDDRRWGVISPRAVKRPFGKYGGTYRIRHPRRGDRLCPFLNVGLADRIFLVVPVNLAQLESLILSDSEVTDAGIDILSRLANLKWIYLDGMGVGENSRPSKDSQNDLADA
jgi:hypothetical protein